MRLLAVLAVALLVVPLAPGAAADTARLEARDTAGKAKTAFEDGETVVFRVTTRVSAFGPVPHRIYLYAGTSPETGTLVTVLDDGTAPNAHPAFDHVFEIAWDQRVDGVRVPAGQYVAQYRAPDGSATPTARVDLDWGPDLVLSYLRVDTTSTGPFTSPEMSANGCVWNDGVQQVPGARITLAFDVAGWTSWPVTTDVRFGHQCPWGPGTAFTIQFVAPPRTTLVRATASAPGAIEQDPSDDARTAPARWTL